MKILIADALIINENRSFIGSVLIDGSLISSVREGLETSPEQHPDIQRIDARGKWLLPGVIDDQVHFREPGLTRKGDFQSESRAAIAGGVTTFLDMPNTIPQTTTIEALAWKLQRAAEVSVANYSFFFGGTNDNAGLVSQLDRQRTPGIKLFLGSSTGNMLVEKDDALQQFFSETELLIAVHAEKEAIILKNRNEYISRFGEGLDISFHPLIRSAEACYASSFEAVALAKKLGTRLHILHLSTERELALLDQGVLSERKITGEACIHHLWFCDDDYQTHGNRIKWNPSIKTESDREALRKAVNDNTIAIVATDHAPHLPAEKEGTYLTAASGGPLVQHSLLAMLCMAADGIFSREKVVEKMAHHPAELFRIDRRGFVREGYFADLVLIDPQQPTKVTKDSLLYKCGWSPFEGFTFPHAVWKTFVNGKEIYSNGKIINEAVGMELKFL